MKLTLPDGTTAEGTPEELAAFAADHASRMPVWFTDAHGAYMPPPAGCECPSAWFGILPPPCPVHNPPRPSITRSSTIGMYSEDVVCD